MQVIIAMPAIICQTGGSGALANASRFCGSRIAPFTNSAEIAVNEVRKEQEGQRQRGHHARQRNGQQARAKGPAEPQHSLRCERQT